MSWGPHEFEKRDGERFPNSCQFCGKTRDADVHQVESEPDSTPDQRSDDDAREVPPDEG